MIKKPIGIANTPNYLFGEKMKFYNFYVKISLPLSIIFSLSEIAQNNGIEELYQTPMWLVLYWLGVSALPSAFLIYALYNKTTVGYYFNLIWIILNQIVILFNCLTLRSADVVGSSIPYLIVGITVVYYFSKRKSVFVNKLFRKKEQSRIGQSDIK